MSKQIFLTVDTECHDIDKLNLYIYGIKNGKPWGVEKILQLAEEENIPVNFFVDVGEEKKYGAQMMEKLVNLIRSYGQPVYFHLHPDYISEDPERTFLWQYSFAEKKQIIWDAYEIYQKYATDSDRLIFRAGRYGVDDEVYSILADLPQPVLDLSYIYDGRKMCKLRQTQAETINAPAEYRGVTLLPNTRFVAFDYLGRKKCVGLDSADATLGEFKQVLTRTKLNTLVYTMHSWNFIRKWFFAPQYMQGDKGMVRKFRKSVKIARKNGFTFADLKDYIYKPEEDELLNLCDGFVGKVRGLINNFLRFQKIGRLNKKYFAVFTFFYVCVLCALAALIWGIFLR